VTLQRATPSGDDRSPTAVVRLSNPGSATATQRLLQFNEPVVYRGWKLYLASVTTVGQDDRGQPVLRATLLANRDPGAPLKHAGSATVALGIACMFWMRAYFFGPRKRAAPADSGRSAP
jgi:hypothetical protein